MCIIISKNSGIEMPTEEVLNNCARTNAHGAGFAYALKGHTPTISKGFMTVETLLGDLRARKIGVEHNLIIHFRYATHGPKSPENCHPFPLTPDFKEMQYLRCTCECAIAHNGVFSDMPASDKYSDTMKFIGGVLASPHIIGGIHTKPVKELIKGYCGYGSKLAFLTKSGITLIGTWNIDEGIQYSNYCYTNYGVKTKVTDYSDYSWKDWKNRYNDKSKEQKYLTAQDKYVCHFCKELKDCKYDAEYMGMLCSECSISLASYTSKED